MGGGHQGLRWEEGYRMRWRGTDVAQVMSASLSYCPDWKRLEIFAQNEVKVCFRFEAGKSNGVWETFLREKDIPGQAEKFWLGSQKFQTYAMMKTGKVNWWPSDWVCSFKRQLVPVFPLNKIFAPWRPPKSASIVAFHGQPDLPQALAGYYRKYDKPAKMHLTCKPTKWILEYWHE